ncbi:hypothetical protein RBSH_03529 [Rhodopirellula baltica SH28]|uniref:Uncharacterized protein n=1 Tax=Rhodopirellula baltica SH28 TaxID=993517 RepID=K5CCA1_RHOBT|nr:hypothetical protein RBSH_03529 [Rhodopirellula baltica SH28]
MGCESRKSLAAIDGWSQFNRTVHHRFYASGWAQFVSGDLVATWRLNESPLAS